MRRLILTRLRVILATALLSSSVITIPVVAQEVTEDAAETVESTLAADVELTTATTADDPKIPKDQLEYLVQPLTVEELDTEASAWLILLKNAVDKYSATEVAIKRINQTVDDEKVAAKAQEKASKEFAAALKSQTAAQKGTPEYEQAERKLEAAKELLVEADKAIRVVEEDKEKLRQSPGFQSAIREALRTNEFAIAEAVLQKTKEVREQLTPGTKSYAAVTQRIESITQSIAEVNRAEEALNKTAEGFPNYEGAVKNLATTRQNLNNAVDAIPGSARIKRQFETKQLASVELDSESSPSAEDSNAIETEVAEQVQDEDTQPTQSVSLTAEQLRAEAEANSDLKRTMLEDLPFQEKERSELIDRLKIVLAALEAKGGDATSFRKYIDSATDLKLDITDAEGLGIRAVNWIFDKEGGLGVIIGLVTFTIISVLSWFASIFASRFSNRLFLQMGNVSNLFRDFAVNIIKRGVFIAGLCLALATIGVDLGPVLAVVGGASFILAFALQSNLGNFASGLMLLVNKPFDVGDEVKVGGFWAYVESISLASTKLKGFDGSAISLPNNTVWGGDIINYTHADIRKISIGIEIKFTQAVEEIRDLWVELASANPKVLTDPGPSIFPFNATYSYHVWIGLAAWSTTDDYWEVYVDLVQGLQKCLDAANIELAAPIQNINLKQMLDGQHPSDVKSLASAATDGESSFQG